MQDCRHLVGLEVANRATVVIEDRAIAEARDVRRVDCPATNLADARDFCVNLGKREREVVPAVNNHVGVLLEVRPDGPEAVADSRTDSARDARDKPDHGVNCRANARLDAFPDFVNLGSHLAPELTHFGLYLPQDALDLVKDKLEGSLRDSFYHVPHGRQVVFDAVPGTAPVTSDERGDRLDDGSDDVHGSNDEVLNAAKYFFDHANKAVAKQLPGLLEGGNVKVKDCFKSSQHVLNGLLDRLPVVNNEVLHLLELVNQEPDKVLNCWPHRVNKVRGHGINNLAEALKVLIGVDNARAKQRQAGHDKNDGGK